MATQPPPYQGGFGPHQPQPQPPYGQATPPQYGPYAPQVPPQQPGPGWGGPPMGPPPGPPKPSNGAKAAGIVLGSVLGLVVLVGGIILALGTDGSTSDTAYDGPTYKLSLPSTLLDGEYRRGQDVSDRLAEARRPNGGRYAEQLEYKGAFYETASGTSKVLVTGTSSTMTNPFYPRYSMLDGAEKGTSVRVEVPRREFTPVAGADPLRCEVLSKHELGARLTFPICSWVDGHTQATVMGTGSDFATTAPEDIDLAAYAQKAADIRDEVRVPAGS